MVEFDTYVPVGNAHRVWLCEISREMFVEQRLQGLDNDFGLFIAIEDLGDGSMSVVAKAPDEDAGRNLLHLVAAGLASTMGRPPGKNAILGLPASP